MTGNYLLDTNIIIAFINEELEVIQRIEHLDSITIASITIGELCFGARKSNHAERNLERLEGLFQSLVVLPCDDKTGRIYGEIKDKLRRKGRPIPEGDIWIAAIAKQHNLIVITRDSDFDAVEDIAIERW